MVCKVFTFVKVIAHEHVVLFGLVGWADAFGPQVGVGAVFVSKYLRLLFRFFVVGKREIVHLLDFFESRLFLNKRLYSLLIELLFSQSFTLVPELILPSVLHTKIFVTFLIKKWLIFAFFMWLILLHFGINSDLLSAFFGFVHLSLTFVDDLIALGASIVVPFTHNRVKLELCNRNVLKAQATRFCFFREVHHF